MTSFRYMIIVRPQDPHLSLFSASVIVASVWMVSLEVITIIITTIIITITTIIVIINTIIITRPKLAYGRQGLVGLLGQDTDQSGTFWGVLSVSLRASGAQLGYKPTWNHPKP